MRIRLPLNSTRPPTTVTASVTLLTIPVIVSQDLAKIDDRHVRIAGDEQALHARTRAGSRAPRTAAMYVCGAVIERPRPEDEHEAAGPEVAQVHARGSWRRAR